MSVNNVGAKKTQEPSLLDVYSTNVNAIKKAVAENIAFPSADGKLKKPKVFLGKPKENADAASHKSNIPKPQITLSNASKKDFEKAMNDMKVEAKQDKKLAELMKRIKPTSKDFDDYPEALTLADAGKYKEALKVIYDER